MLPPMCMQKLCGHQRSSTERLLKHMCVSQRAISEVDLTSLFGMGKSGKWLKLGVWNEPLWPKTVDTSFYSGVVLKPTLHVFSMQMEVMPHLFLPPPESTLSPTWSWMLSQWELQWHFCNKNETKQKNQGGIQTSCFNFAINSLKKQRQ